MSRDVHPLLLEIAGALTFDDQVAVPSPSLRARLLSSLVPPSWERWCAAAGDLWDLAPDSVRACFVRAMDHGQWEPSAPGVGLFHLTPGPAGLGADAGIVRFDPGTRFPKHEHLGVERYVVLSGELHDSSGSVERPGDILTRDASVRHSFYVPGPETTYIALLLTEGIQFVG